MASYNVHGGHSLVCRGAAKFLDEVNEDRKVKNKVIELMRNAGHTVYDCTDDVGGTSNANLANIVKKCNAHKVDLDISIHLNAGGGTGVEVWNYDERTKAVSDRMCANVSSALGIANRGTKYQPEFYVLRNTNSLAVLIECCFVDSTTDRDRWNADKCAQAIVEGVLGSKIQPPNTGSGSTTPAAKPETQAKKSVAEIAKEVIAGKWGNGNDRKTRLTQAGYDYNAVQSEVNRQLGQTAPAPKPAAPAQKSVDEIAKEVIAGKWGNGDARKSALTKAGYDFNAVQSKVNQMLGASNPAPAPQKSVDDIAREVIAGKWGNGNDRKARLEAAGYNYSAVQSRVNALL